MLAAMLWPMLQVVFLLIALTFIFGILDERIAIGSRPLVLGVVFGCFGILNIMFRVELAPGIIIDLRNPLVIVAGLFGGGWAAFISAACIAAYRLLVVGGVGAMSAMGGIFTVALMTDFVRQRMQQPKTIGVFIVLAWLSGGISAFWASLSLDATQLQLFLESFIPVALILYPLLTVVLGLLLLQESERVQMKRLLQANEIRYRAIFDTTYQFTGLLGTDGEVIEMNRTALEFENVSQADVVGKPFWQTSSWRSEVAQNRLQDAIKKAAGGQFVRYREQMIAPDETTVISDFSLKPIRDDAGQVTMLLAEGRDITREINTERENMALILEQERTQMLKQFIQDSSHHLRTPVTILQMSNHLMKGTIEEAIEQVKGLEAALKADDSNNANQQASTLRGFVLNCAKRAGRFDRALTNLSTLIEQLLALSGLDDMDEIPPQYAILCDVLQDVIDDFKPLAASKAITLSFNSPPTSTSISLNQANMRLALQNIIENALRYTREHGHVTVSYSEAEGQAHIQVVDNGIGIPPNVQHRIFERFFRADNAMSFDSNGTGLGLAIADKIIKQAAGTITYTSALDLGTTATITLPLQQTMPEQ